MATEFQILETDMPLIDIPHISTITLLSGWAERDTTNFKSAALNIIDKYPILTGAFKNKSEKEIVVEPGKHKDLVMEIEAPSNFQIPGTTEDAINISYCALQPVFEPHRLDPNRKALEAGTPLFRVILMKLPANHMAYCIELSHLIADGFTFGGLLQQIDLSCKGESFQEFEWGKPSSGHRWFPSSFNEADTNLLSEGFMPAFFANSEKYGPREVTIQIINRDAVEKMKREGRRAAQALGATNWSTNDILTAGLCEAFEDVHTAGSTCKVFGMAVNVRGTIPGCKATSAGNFFRCFFFPAHEGRNPAFFRALCPKTLEYYSRDGNGRISESPARECVEKGDVMYLSNNITHSQTIEPPGTKVICHVFGHDIIGLPVDANFMWKVDKDGTLAVMDNYSRGKRGDAVSKHLSSCKTYGRLFKPLQFRLWTSRFQAKPAKHEPAA